MPTEIHTQLPGLGWRQRLDIDGKAMPAISHLPPYRHRQGVCISLIRAIELAGSLLHSERIVCGQPAISSPLYISRMIQITISPTISNRAQILQLSSYRTTPCITNCKPTNCKPTQLYLNHRHFIHTRYLKQTHSDKTPTFLAVTATATPLVEDRLADKSACLEHEYSVHSSCTCIYLWFWDIAALP